MIYDLIIVAILALSWLAPGTATFGHCRHVLGLMLWATVFVPCWLITEGVDSTLRFVMDQSPSGY